MLAKVLGLHGKITIGDKALKLFLSGTEGVDLALRWKEKTDLPFVFARLCFNLTKKRSQNLPRLLPKNGSKSPKLSSKKRLAREILLLPSSSGILIIFTTAWITEQKNRSNSFSR